MATSTSALPLSEEAFHPGEFIADELRARGMTQRELARRMGRPYQAVNEIIRGRKAVTAETALALARVFEQRAETWMALQARYELTVARAREAGVAEDRPAAS
ncbi:MAG: HigA family addiction module antitoxin [Dehalococcoidia bacterium]